MTFKTAACAAILMLAAAGPALAAESMDARIDSRARAVEARMIAWRRDIHAHPELGNAETRTAALVADHLRKLGLKVRTGVAGTGVVAVLEGGKPGPVVALRADMDALPVKEEVNLPFASRARGTYRGNPVDVMHACGHDAHVAILMATAEVLTGMKADLRGSVVFIFQPAEEGPSDFIPDGKRFFGARQMIAEGVLDAPKVDVIFGLHVGAGAPAGQLSWRAGPAMAAADQLSIQVKGRQTHGAMPWLGVDPIVISSQIVLGLQTIASRQIDVTREPSVITIGQIHGGNRSNIIPDSVMMEGTIRTYDRAMQADIAERIARTAEGIAESAGGEAKVDIVELYGPTVNPEALTARMEPTLIRIAGDNRAISGKRSGSEDFSFYQDKVPGLFFFLGVTAPDRLKDAAPNHSPRFEVDESGLIQGVRALSALTLDYMAGAPGK